MLITRRTAIRSGALLATGTIAGCLGGGSSGDTVDSLPAPAIGPDDAPVTVEGFEDYACTHCGTFALEDLATIESEYVESGDVRYEHHDFPVPVDQQWSWKVPSAARAVQDTVDDSAFLEYTRALYRNMDDYSLELIGTLAEDVGADPETVRNAAEVERYRPVVESDRSYGQDLGVNGTPMVFVNGQKAESYEFEAVSALIEDELA
ncbi:MAG: thioredoxin domain-containing protein [Halodesulfurarchaeum sp.]